MFAEIDNKNQELLEEEMGDMFFALINAARLYNIDAEQALERTNQKFIRRFQFIEQGAVSRSKTLENMSIEEMEDLWQMAKKYEFKLQ